MALTYMCACFCKAQNETSQAMKQAAKEAHTLGKTNLEKMRTVARAYSEKRECSVQEAVYLLMPKLWLRKTFPKAISLNSNIPERDNKIFRSKTKLDKLPENSAEAFQRNMLNCYIDQLDACFQNGKYAEVDSLCFADFLGSYYVK